MLFISAAFLFISLGSSSNIAFNKCYQILDQWYKSYFRISFLSRNMKKIEEKLHERKATTSSIATRALFLWERRKHTRNTANIY